MSRGVAGSRAQAELSDLAADLRGVAKGLAAEDDWMSRANAESALALSTLARDAAPIDSPDRARFPSRHSANPEIDDLKAPLLASLGAADLALATVNDLLAELRARAEETRTDTRSRVEESRARLSKLQEDLPEQLRELRERFTVDELRTAAEGYVEAATSRYNELVERGEAALERLRSQAGFEDASPRAEGYVDQAVELTQEALGTVASQTRAVGERAAKLVGIELPKKAPAKRARAKKVSANKHVGKKATRK